MMSAIVIAAAAATVFRIIPLACSGDRLAVAGGGVLQLATGATCNGIVPGRPLAISLDADNRATPQRLVADVHPASDIPRAAYVIAPAAESNADQTAVVSVRIDVRAPANTPPGDDIYLSTERSNWSPNEIRMNRVDARDFRLDLQVHRGARVAFRITRGSWQTLERDANRALPPAHLANGDPSAHVTVDVAAWADID